MLTKEKLLEILQSIEGSKNAALVQYSVKPGTAVGDNYASEMARVDMTAKVDGKGKEYHWMVKMTPTVTSFSKGMHFEETEILYYRDVLPAWNKMAEEKGASFRMNNIPAPYTEIQPDDGDKRSILVMENLALHGYRDAANKKKGLSLVYAKAALEEIARFHAMGYSYMMSYPGGLEEAKKANDIFITDFVNVRPTPAGVNMARSMVTGAAGILELIQEPGQDFVGIYNRFLEENDPVEYCRKIFSPNPDGFNVIGHGDLWFNNMLFKQVLIQPFYFYI